VYRKEEKRAQLSRVLSPLFYALGGLLARVVQVLCRTVAYFYFCLRLLLRHTAFALGDVEVKFKFFLAETKNQANEK
jgi:hypothetical protein